MRRQRVVIVFAMVILMTASSLQAAGFAQVFGVAHSWEGRFTGTRLTSMGSADIATDQGPGALLVNPAPLLDGVGITVGYDHVEYPLDGLLGTDVDEDYSFFSARVVWRDWCFSACLNENAIDGLNVRTAYAGSLGEIDIRDRMTLVGLSRRLSRWEGTGAGLQWSGGIVYRRYSAVKKVVSGDFSLADDAEGGAGTWDVGTTAAWRFSGNAGTGRIAIALAWQNALNNKWSTGDLEQELPRVLRFGITNELVADRRRQEAFKVVAAFTHTVYLNDHTDDVSHAGVEATFLRLLALRVGHSQRFASDNISWGVGLTLNQIAGRPLDVAIDWGEVDRAVRSVPDLEVYMFGVRVRVGL